MIYYLRQGGLMPGPQHEEIRVDGALFTMWRSVSIASRPPSPIGRFGGRLNSGREASLAEAALAAEKAGDFVVTPKPDAVVESVELGGGGAAGGRARPGGGTLGTIAC